MLFIRVLQSITGKGYFQEGVQILPGNKYFFLLFPEYFPIIHHFKGKSSICGINLGRNFLLDRAFGNF
jgi:hypothetical protein